MTSIAYRTAIPGSSKSQIAWSADSLPGKELLHVRSGDAAGHLPNHGTIHQEIYSAGNTGNIPRYNRRPAVDQHVTRDGCTARGCIDIPSRCSGKQ